MVTCLLCYIFHRHRPLLHALCEQNEITPGNFVAAKLFVENWTKKFFFIQANERQFKPPKPPAEHFYLLQVARHEHINTIHQIGIVKHLRPYYFRQTVYTLTHIHRFRV